MNKYEERNTKQAQLCTTKCKQEI